MSFLDSLLATRDKLKPTVTSVTYADGRKYLESSAVSKKICENLPGYVVDMKPDLVPCKVLDGLYLGSQDCCDRDVLNEYGIHVVLSVGVDAPVKYAGFTYKFVECLDLPETDLERCLADCLPFLTNSVEEGKRVLVHCNAGVSRSASIVIGYLMAKRSLGFDEAYSMVKGTRGCARPNAGFERFLRNLNTKK
ncbi:dual specificity protein phosphatase 19-like [Cylas formicarius]|uniref:dual specificity protein phosphatase 19-like n=1 Tax=Cylas formicarius TaxID=197179 RepID=UPI00295844A2|nr:dual specificity protein phosphatase 19-like [Cylas formicarius]